MRRVLFSILFVPLACTVVRAGAADATVAFGFDGPATLTGVEGETVEAEYTLTMAHSGDGAGVQAYSLGVTSDNIAITSVTWEGTDAEALFVDGFQFCEVFEAESGATNALCGIVLCNGCPAALPVNATSSIGRITVARQLDADGVASLRYEDNLEGSGLPVRNIATRLGETLLPELGSTDIELVALPDCCSGELNMGFSLERVQSPEPIAVSDADPICLQRDVELVSESREGDVGAADLYVNISSNLPEVGVQGWSLSLAVSGANVDSITVENTAGAPAPDGLFDGGFENSSVALPEDNDGQAGAVSAIVLCFGCPITLPLVGTESVMRVGISANEAQGEADQVATAWFVDGLVGAGQPVQNVLTRSGNSNLACNHFIARANVVFRLRAVADFVRGDSNSDGRVNIADPIWSLNELFRDGPASTCQKAADANDDGSVDLADVGFTVLYLFLNGDLPPAPFPGCGEDPTEDALTCEASNCDA